MIRKPLTSGGGAKRESASERSARISGRYLIVATLIGVLATTVAGFATNGFGHLIGNHVGAPSTSDEPSGPPVRINSVTLDTTSRPTLGFLLPQRLVLTPSQLSSLNKLSPNDPMYFSWFTLHGGVEPIESVVKLVVEGNRTYPVQIIYMRVQDRCAAPLNGTYFLNSPPGGGEPNVNFEFDLDKAVPTPQVQYVGGNYFRTHTISLQRGESETFEIGSFAVSHYCSYALQMTVVDGSRTVFETVNNHGKPFQVSAVLTSFAQYKALYIGGTSPGQAAPFVSKDPTHFK